MTVQELIDELLKIEDKSKPIHIRSIYVDDYWEEVDEVYEGYVLGAPEIRLR